MLLNYRKTKEILNKYELKEVRTEAVSSLSELKRKSQNFSFPVFLKNSEIVHKTEKEALKKCANKKDLENFYNKIKGKGGTFLIQEEARGEEVFIGAKRDGVFGEVISFGLGGVFVEVLEDISIGILPLKKREIKGLIKSVKGFRVLNGFRGREKADMGELCQITGKIGKILRENNWIKEIDVNPLFVSGKKQEIADIKIYV